MKNRLGIADIVITLLIVVASGCAIGVTVAHRADKGDGVLTMENYEQFLKVDAYLGGNYGGGPYSMVYDYTVQFKPALYYELTDVTVWYTLESEYSDIGGTYSHTFTASYKTPVGVTGKVNYNYPSHLSITEVMSIQSTMKVTVFSVSGNYRYIGGEK